MRMSKRSGKTIALHDLLDEVSVDAARYFFNSRAATSPVDFDLTWPSGRTVRTPSTMSNMPTPGSAPWWPAWPRRATPCRRPTKSKGSAHCGGGDRPRPHPGQVPGGRSIPPPGTTIPPGSTGT